MLVFILVALAEAVNVLLLTVQVQRLTKERDALIAERVDIRAEANAAIQAAALERIRASMLPVTPWSQPGSRQAN